MKNLKNIILYLGIYFGIYSLINLIYYSGVIAKIGALVGLGSSIYLIIKSLKQKR